MRLLPLMGGAALMSLAACSTFNANNNSKDLANMCEPATYAVYFGTGKSSFDTGASQTLDDIQMRYTGCDIYRIELEGHADSVGASPANLELSDDRAEAVMSALNVRGVSASRITIIPMGEQEAIMDGDANPFERKVIIRLVP